MPDKKLRTKALLILVFLSFISLILTSPFSYNQLKKMNLPLIGPISDVAAQTYENFSLYTEVEDIANRITTLASGRQVRFSSMDRDHDCYNYYDFGADYFGDFEIEFVYYRDAMNNYAYPSHIVLTDALDDIKGLQDANEPYVCMREYRSSGSSKTTYLREFDGTTSYEDSTAADLLSDDTYYYFTFRKRTLSMSLEIYSDSGRTSLMDNLTVTLQSDYTFRYLMGGVTYNSAQSGMEFTTRIDYCEIIDPDYEAGLGTVTLNNPVDPWITYKDGESQNFTYTPAFLGAITNSSLWTDFNGSWALAAWNSSQVINGSVNGISVDLPSTPGVYKWNIEVFGSSAWGSSNFSLTLTESCFNVTNPDYNMSWSSNTSHTIDIGAYNLSILHTGLIENTTAASSTILSGTQQSHSTVYFSQGADFVMSWLYYESAQYQIRDDSSYITGYEKDGLNTGLYLDLPQATEFVITNPYLCSVIPIEINFRHWVFAQEKYYNFRGNFSYVGGWAGISNVSFRFSDSLHTIQASYHPYNSESDQWILDSGSEYVFFMPGAVTNVTDLKLQVNWQLFFREDILDQRNVTVYANVTTQGLGGFTSSGWTDTEYVFTIYNVGGERDFNFEGSGAQTVGGDTFNLYTGGSYGADILEDHYDQEWQADLDPSYLLYVPYYGIATTQNRIAAEQIIEYASYPEATIEPNYAVHFYKGNTGVSDTIYMYKQFTTQTTQFYFQFYALLEQTDENVTLEMNYGPTGLLGLALVFNSTGGIHYIDDLGVAYTSESYVANTWKNVTIIPDIPNDQWDLYIDSALVIDDGNFRASRTALDRIVIYMGPGGASPPYSFWLDTLRIWRSSSGGMGGIAEATLLYKNLQHVHAQFALSISPGGPEADQAITVPDEAFIELGIDYCVRDIWVLNAYKVRLNVTRASLVGQTAWNTITGYASSNWVEVTATWFEHNDTQIKQDIFYTYWEGLYSGDSSADRSRFWLDLWFNRANASSVAGGRISSYYYGVYEGTHPWLRWAYGSNWQIMGKENQKSDFFWELEDVYKTANVTSPEITLVRFRVKVYRTQTHDWQWVLQDWDHLDFNQAEGKMKGINTPAFIAPLVPSLPASGLGGILGGFMQWLINTLVNTLTWGALEAWDLFVQFLDTIAAGFGYPGLFSEWIIPTLTTLINQFFTYLANLVTLILQTLTFISAIFTPFITFMVSTITYWVQFINFIFDFFTGVYDTGVNVWTTFSMDSWVTLAAILYPVYILYRVAEDESLDPLVFHATAWKNVVAFFIMVLKALIDLTIRLLSFIIESIPVVE